jgi:hypothetical protein
MDGSGSEGATLKTADNRFLAYAILRNFKPIWERDTDAAPAREIERSGAILSPQHHRRGGGQGG